MKKYIIKYETYSGDCRCEDIQAWSKQSAISQLTNCKIIYWIK